MSSIDDEIVRAKMRKLRVLTKVWKTQRISNSKSRAASSLS